MNESWHIPRASLSGPSSSATAASSSSGSQKSNSNPSTMRKHYSRSFCHVDGRLNYGFQNSENASRRLYSIDIDIGDRDSSRQQVPQRPRSHSGARLSRSKSVTNDNIMSGIKRGSRSSQGSTDSNNSTQSNSSVSLLLTAANLERFVEIHKKFPAHGSLRQSRLNYNSNITMPKQQSDSSQIETYKTTDQRTNSNEKGDTVLTIDPNLHFVKTKDVDTMSIASSTHFTMVNGIGGPQRKTRDGICSRGHQITVLILSMSMLFLIGILAAVYLLEMRAREMPH